MNVHPFVLKTWKEHRLDLVFFVIGFYFNLSSFGFNNLLLQKTCFPEGPPGTNVICNNTQALKQYSALGSMRGAVRELLSGMVALMAGPWRDHTGLTLPLMVLGHVGEVIACGAALVAALMWSYSTWATVVVDSLCGLMGGRILVSVAVISYATDHSSDKNRAVRLAILVTAGLGGMSSAYAIAGYLLKTLGYHWFYASLIAIYLVNLALSFHSVKDGPRRNPGVKMKPIHVFRRLKSIFTPRKNFFVSWVMLFASFAIAGVMVAEQSIIHGFFQRVLSINPEKAGLLLSFRLFLSLIMSLIATPVFIKVLKMSEFTVAIICTIPSAISCFGMAFVSTLAGAYISYAFDLMRITLTSILWAILTYCVPKCEVGVYASFLHFGEAVTPLLINPLYAFIFNSTIDYFPGAFFVISGMMIVITAILLVVSSFKFEKIEVAVDDKLTKKDNEECETKITSC